MRKESAAARYQANMRNRAQNPHAERSLDDQINELRKMLSKKRAAYYDRDRAEEYKIESALLDLIIQHPYKGAPSVMTMSCGNSAISLVDNRKAFIGIEASTLDPEYEQIVEDGLRFFEKRPYAVGVTTAGVSGEQALAVIEYFEKEALARKMFQELQDRLKLRRFDPNSDRFKADFSNLGAKVRGGDPVAIALADIKSGDSQARTGAVPESVLIRKPKLVDRSRPELQKPPAPRDEEAPVSPHIGSHSKRIKGKEYIIDVRHVRGPNSAKGGKCYIEIRLNNIVVRSMWFTLPQDAETAAKDIARAMSTLDIVVATSSEPPENKVFLNKLNKIMSRAIYNYGAM